MKSFNSLWDELALSKQSPRVGSRTSELLELGVHAIGKKVVEEAAEVWMAAEHESSERTAEEISQLIYHLQVLMTAKGIDIADLEKNL